MRICTYNFEIPERIWEKKNGILGIKLLIVGSTCGERLSDAMAKSRHGQDRQDNTAFTLVGSANDNYYQPPLKASSVLESSLSKSAAEAAKPSA